ncbi:MAG: FeoB-associated Cys-rich membrane protein [Clostridia bacterium]|nr:FeoB-associated Cys-rich membrane protein [Clostridia bacterium]
MENIIIILIVAAVLAAAVCYIVKQKKKGSKCIGCPYAENCNKKQCR